MPVADPVTMQTESFRIIAINHFTGARDYASTRASRVCPTPGRKKFVHSIDMQRLFVTGLRTVILRICATLIACAACGMPLGAYQASCPAPEGNPAGNYLVPGSLGDVKYRAVMTLDAYAPAGVRRPAVVLIHGSQGDKSTHLTQLFEVIERAGFAWFSINYRNLDDVRAAVAYIRCPGRFNISSRMVLVAEDTGAPLALTCTISSRLPWSSTPSSARLRA